MADPLSIVAGAAGIADICFRLIGYMRDIHTGTVRIEDEVAALIGEIEALNSTSIAIQQAFRNYLSPTPSTDALERFDDWDSHDLWEHIGRALQNCQNIIERLEKTVKEIYGKTGPAVDTVRDALFKAHRKRAKEGELRLCREQLTTHQSGLHLLLQAVIHHSTRSSREANTRSFDIIVAQIAAVQHSIDSCSINISQQDHQTSSALKDLRQSVDHVDAIHRPTTTNEHFDTPQSVSKDFTGREAALKDLAEVFITPAGAYHGNRQRRFVIYGIGGSGKTQFCSKFAEENRDRFWGVFWIDASTLARIKQTYAHISKIAGRDPNEKAAMHWLSNMKHQWLLIIDNADDPSINLENYTPKGNRGHILVTTRNPANKHFGNVGSEYLEFHGLSIREANSLLLKVARQPIPWDSACESSASVITKALGFLTLAIVQAGAAIRSGYCNLKDYLNFYERSWSRIRQARLEQSNIEDELPHDKHVHATWEVGLQPIEIKASAGSRLAKDAIQLLAILSFLHWENVPYEMFERAVENRGTEVEHSRGEDQASRENHRKDSQSLSRKIAKLRILLLSLISKSINPPLPSVIRDAIPLGRWDESNVRIRSALNELVQMSLITHNNSSDSYSMHPIVHKWAQERPSMRLGEQAVWSEAAALTLSYSLLIPPLRNATRDEDYERSILPHVDYVISRRKSIFDQISTRQHTRWTSLFSPTSAMNLERMRMCAKFGSAYYHCGRWKQAKELLLEVKLYMEWMFGSEDAKTRRVTLALAEVLWYMGESAEAELLQRGVLETCLKFLGPDHLDTLRVKDKLGQALWQQGHYTEARKIQEEALEGFKRHLPYDHEDRLSTMDHLARTIAKFWEREDMHEAYSLHLKAISGMERIFDSDNVRLSSAKENLARLAVHLGEDTTKSANITIMEVVESRKRKLGKEHPLTLHAMGSAAVVKNSLGHIKEAEALVLAALPIAERNVGKDHMGTLFGYTTLATIRIHQRRYIEAEGILLKVIDQMKRMPTRREDFHPDRLGAMIELTKCYRLQGKIADSIGMCEEALKGFRKISVREHPLARDLKEAQRRMIGHQNALDRGEAGDLDISSEEPGFYRLFQVF